MVGHTVASDAALISLGIDCYSNANPSAISVGGSLGTWVGVSGGGAAGGGGGREPPPPAPCRFQGGLPSPWPATPAMPDNGRYPSAPLVVGLGGLTPRILTVR